MQPLVRFELIVLSHRRLPREAKRMVKGIEKLLRKGIQRETSRSVVSRLLEQLNLAREPGYTFETIKCLEFAGFESYTTTPRLYWAYTKCEEDDESSDGASPEAQGEPWTQAERLHFLALFHKWGQDWSALSEQLPGRDVVQCTFHGRRVVKQLRKLFSMGKEALAQIESGVSESIEFLVELAKYQIERRQLLKAYPLQSLVARVPPLASQNSSITLQESSGADAGSEVQLPSSPPPLQAEPLALRDECLPSYLVRELTKGYVTPRCDYRVRCLLSALQNELAL